MLEKKNERKANFKELELEQRKKEFEFQKQKYEEEAAERREKLQLELEEKRAFLALLKTRLQKENDFLVIIFRIIRICT